MNNVVRSLIPCIALALGFAEAQASVPARFNFTARLVNGTAPAQGDVQLTAQLYRADSGGTSIWTESHTAKATDGLVAVALGAQSPLDAAIVDGAALYLELIVDGTVLSPRLPIGTVPYAMLADRADTADRLGTLAPGDVQRRVMGTCAPGSSIQSIDMAGGVTCEPDDDMQYAFGNGLLLTGNSVSVDATAIQRRVSGTCPAGSSVNGVGADGSVSCELDDNTTYTGTNGISIDASNTVRPDYSLVQRRVASCAAGSSIRGVNSDGSVVCEVDTDTNTTYTAGSGLALSGTQFRFSPTISQNYELIDNTTSNGWVERNLGGHTLCFLSMVDVYNANGGCEAAPNNDGTWSLWARTATNFVPVRCWARCID